MFHLLSLCLSPEPPIDDTSLSTIFDRGLVGHSVGMEFYCSCMESFEELQTLSSRVHRNGRHRSGETTLQVRSGPHTTRCSW